MEEGTIIILTAVEEEGEEEEATLRRVEAVTISIIVITV